MLPSRLYPLCRDRGEAEDEGLDTAGRLQAEPPDVHSFHKVEIEVADLREYASYINQKLEQGTYKRGHEGNRQVTKEELSLLLRDSSDNTDSQIIEHYGMDDIDAETLEKYRRSFNILNPGHAYEELNDRDFLIQMDGYDINRQFQT